MQFPVPQFTDIEDRIIGGLSFKQFGIVFAAAVLTFVVYTISKNVFATVIVGVLTGIPAIALTFGKMNGRPLYASFGSFLRYLFGAKVYVFQKQAHYMQESQDQNLVVTEVQPSKDHKQTTVKIKELSYILQQQASEEQVLLQRIKENKQVANQA